MNCHVVVAVCDLQNWRKIEKSILELKLSKQIHDRSLVGKLDSFRNKKEEESFVEAGNKLEKQKRELIDRTCIQKDLDSAIEVFSGMHTFVGNGFNDPVTDAGAIESQKTLATYLSSFTYCSVPAWVSTNQEVIAIFAGHGTIRDEKLYLYYEKSDGYRVICVFSYRKILAELVRFYLGKRFFR